MGVRHSPAGARVPTCLKPAGSYTLGAFLDGTRLLQGAGAVRLIPSVGLSGFAPAATYAADAFNLQSAAHYPSAIHLGTLQPLGFKPPGEPGGRCGTRG